MQMKKVNMTKQAVFMAVLLLAAPAWAINKCSASDGKVVFQDAPCAGQGEVLNVRPASGHADPATQASAQERLQKLKADNAMAEAIRLHRPLVGMTTAQLQDAMGLPTRVNASNYNGALHDQLIYEGRGETWYVYTRNGVVTSVQHQQGVLGTATDTRPRGRCPTSHEINNAITSASSNYLSEAEREQRWKAIREMQGCGK